MSSTLLRKLSNHSSDSARPVTSSLCKAITSCVVLLASFNSWRTLSFTDRSTVLLAFLLIISVTFFEFFVTAPLNDALLRKRYSICREVHVSTSSLLISEGVLEPSPTQSFDATRRINCNSSGSKDQIVFRRYEILQLYKIETKTQRLNVLFLVRTLRPLKRQLTYYYTHFLLYPSKAQCHQCHFFVYLKVGGGQLERLCYFDHHTHFITRTVIILPCNHVLWLYFSFYVNFM